MKMMVMEYDNDDDDDEDDGNINASSYGSIQRKIHTVRQTDKQKYICLHTINFIQLYLPFR